MKCAEGNMNSTNNSNALSNTINGMTRILANNAKSSLIKKCNDALKSAAKDVTKIFNDIIERYEDTIVDIVTHEKFPVYCSIASIVISLVVERKIRAILTRQP